MDSRPLRPPLDDVSALRMLCESVYQPTDARRDALLACDWTSMPRIADAIASLQRPVSPAAVSDLAWRLINDAVKALEPRFPPLPGTVNPAEVVRWHVLDRQPWPSLEAQLREEGRPVSRGTLIRRQHEFLPYLREWARATDGDDEIEPVELPEAEQTVRTVTSVEGRGEATLQAPLLEPTFAAATAPARARGARHARRSWLALALVGVAGGIGWLIFAAGAFESSAPREGTVRSGAKPLIRSILAGRQVVKFEYAMGLPADYPRLDLPELDGYRIQALVLEREIGRPEILFSYVKIGEGAPRFCLWDPLTRTMRWESSYWPPPEQRLTHAGVGNEVLEESYHVSRLNYAGREGDLGRYAALCLMQAYSPTFVIFVDLENGEVLGSYVHPGHFYSSIVADLDRDGRGEVVFGGTDNATRRATVVALTPAPGVRAASTVAWNTSGLEQAMARVFLPVWEPALEETQGVQLATLELNEQCFDLATRILTVGVGHEKGSVFHVRLQSDLTAAPVRPLVLWSNDERTLRTLGLDPPDFTGWESQIELAPHSNPNSLVRD